MPPRTQSCAGRPCPPIWRSSTSLSCQTSSCRYGIHPSPTNPTTNTPLLTPSLPATFTGPRRPFGALRPWHILYACTASGAHDLAKPSPLPQLSRHSTPATLAFQLYMQCVVPYVLRHIAWPCSDLSKALKIKCPGMIQNLLQTMLTTPLRGGTHLMSQWPAGDFHPSHVCSPQNGIDPPYIEYKGGHIEATQQINSMQTSLPREVKTDNGTEIG